MPPCGARQRAPHLLFQAPPPMNRPVSRDEPPGSRPSRLALFFNHLQLPEGWPSECLSSTEKRIPMTNFKTRMIVAAATVLAAAGTASAQTLKVEIPFPFRVGSKVMAAGTYSVIDIDRRSG